MSPKRLLIVAYYFPPIGGIGSIRLGSFAAHLPEFGWDPTVIAPRRTPHAPGADLDPSVPVVRSTSLEVGRFLLRISPSLVFPDAQIGWYPGAVLAGSRLIRHESFDAVLSSAFPITAHLVGRRLSGRAGIPWVAEFRDPWSARLGESHPHHRRAISLERELAGSASRVVMPNPSLAQHYEQAWQCEIDVVPNGHDGPIPTRQPPDRPTITHVGTYYPSFQRLTSLWAAIRQLLDTGELKSPILRFVGEVPVELRRELERFELWQFVEQAGFVGHSESMSLAAGSSVLVASGPVATDLVGRDVVPAKLFEYLATSVPIVYFGDPHGDAAQLLVRYPGCYTVDHGNLEGAVVALERALADGPVDREVAELSRRNRTRQLAEVLDAVVS